MAGAECKEHKGQDPNTPVPLHGQPNENPVGQWNTNVTACAGNSVLAIINGKVLNSITECSVSSGFIGFQSEGAEIEIRRVALWPLPSKLKTAVAPEGAPPLGYTDILDAEFRGWPPRGSSPF